MSLCFCFVFLKVPVHQVLVLETVSVKNGLGPHLLASAGLGWFIWKVAVHKVWLAQFWIIKNNVQICDTHSYAYTVTAACCI